MHDISSDMTNPAKFTRQVTRETTLISLQQSSRPTIHRHSTSWTLPHSSSSSTFGQVSPLSHTSHTSHIHSALTAPHTSHISQLSRTSHTHISHSSHTHHALTLSLAYTVSHTTSHTHHTLTYLTAFTHITHSHSHSWKF